MVWDLICHVFAIWSTLPAQSFGVNMFLEYWLNDLQITRVMFSMIWLTSSMISACFVLLTGRIVDRYGSQNTLKIFYPVYVLSVTGLGFVNDAITLACALTLMRITGPEAVSIIVNIATVQKHTEHTAKALSVLAWAESIFMFAPPLVLYAIQQIGWRYTIHILSITIAFMMVPSTCLHIPHQPKTNTPTNNNNIPRFLYLFMVQNAVFNLFWCGLNLFAIDIMRERGFGAFEGSFGIFVPLSVGFVGSTLVMGWIFDRCKQHVVYIMNLVTLVVAGTMIWTLFLTPWTLWVCFFIYGWCVGSHVILYTLIYIKYAKESLARVQSMHNGLGMIALGLAPVLFSICKEWFGSYSYVIVMISALIMVINIIILGSYTRCFFVF